MSTLHEKRILIAGGTGAVGRHLVRALLAAGATVVVPSRSLEKLELLELELDGAQRARLLPLTGDITDPHDGPRLLGMAGPLHGAAASLGRYRPAPEVLSAPLADLRAVLDDYVGAHLAVARAVIPGLRERGGGYVMINGPLAFEPLFPGAGLVSIATAAQAMLATVLMKETAETAVRVNELVLYSSFGRGDEERNEVTGEDVGRSLAHLLSDRGAGVRGQRIHLKAAEMKVDVGTGS